jgi:hypothetical protein
MALLVVRVLRGYCWLSAPPAAVDRRRAWRNHAGRQLLSNVVRQVVEQGLNEPENRHFFARLGANLTEYAIRRQWF